MLATQRVIDVLADRIERAYCLRRPDWHKGCTSSRVWTCAAEQLVAAHASDPSVPTDPELFVAAQGADTDYPDPWKELTEPDAMRRYRRSVRAIVRGLRQELAGEIRLAEERIGAGEAVARVLSSQSRRLSPLGRYIVARRAGRVALARRFLADALVQHQSCPLYRQASADLLPPEHYPAPVTSEPAVPQPPKGRPRTQVSLN